MEDPTSSENAVPSTRVATASPRTVSTVPIGESSNALSSCAYCPGAIGPASADIKSGGNAEPPSVIRVAGLIWEKYSTTRNCVPSVIVIRRSKPTREKSARKRASAPGTIRASPSGAPRIIGELTGPSVK